MQLVLAQKGTSLKHKILPIYRPALCVHMCVCLRLIHLMYTIILKSLPDPGCTLNNLKRQETASLTTWVGEREIIQQRNCQS